MAVELFKSLAKKMGKEKSMSILQKMAYGGSSMPKDVMQLVKSRMGGSMIDPELSMAGKGKNMDDYRYGGSMKKKKSKKKM